MSKAILNEWKKWLFDERVNGLMTDFSGKPQLDGFKEIRRDQSIPTNLMQSEMVCQCRW